MNINFILSFHERVLTFQTRMLVSIVTNRLNLCVIDIIFGMHDFIINKYMVTKTRIFFFWGGGGGQTKSGGFFRIFFLMGKHFFTEFFFFFQSKHTSSQIWY